jgi:hypothetical protein
MKDPARRRDFAQGEQTPRANALFASWNNRWRASRPRGWELRVAYSDRWVRFHSLPGSKRYAGNESEQLEVLHRDRTLIDELFGEDSLESLIVIAEEFGPKDLSSGWTRTNLPGSWPWKSTVTWSLPTDDQDSASYFWVTSGIIGSNLDDVLTSVADDEGRCVFTDPTVDWLFCPYDGGVDVFAPTTHDRDLLKARHTDWLSQRTDAL